MRRTSFTHADAIPRPRWTVPALVVAAAMLAGWPISAASAADPRIAAEPVVAAAAQQGVPAVSARQAASLIARYTDIRLIDVRTFGEIVFGGLPEPVHFHVPYVLIDEAHDYDAANGRYRLVANPDFPAAIANVLKGEAGGRQTTLLLICSIGERSTKAASYLAKLGYSNVYAVIDGTDGMAGASSASGLSGWRAAGLPWSANMNSRQAYKSPSM